jgi:catalase
VLIADGTDAALIASLQAAAEQEGASVELVAPAIGGVETSDGKRIETDQQIDGGPSVLYDAVALLLSAAGASELAHQPAARDFVTDAYAHYKFIGYTGDAAPLLDATGISELRDAGFIELSGNGSATSFISACRQLRFWEREAAA